VSRRFLSLTGASIISAVGSLPLHLAPVLVSSLTTSSKASVAEAGWITGSIFLGQVTSALTLPAFGVGSFTRAALGGVSLALIGGLTLFDGGFTALLGSWFTVGLCCGAFQYVGITTAAEYADPRVSFAFRLGLVLVLAGITVASLQATGVIEYQQLTITLAAVFGFLLFLGTILFNPTTYPIERAVAVLPSWREALNLATIFTVFVGQTGFLAYVIQNAAARGMDLANVVWSFAAIKVITGLAGR
jgi:hypothetical protein